MAGKVLKLSVLDQSPIPSGATPAAALANSVALAQHAEALGYHRYWVAEHHGSASFAGCAPEILISAIAQQTRRIRVGSGGVMLMHYSPLKVAEIFKLLQTLYPQRIDLGIGRAPGSDGITAAALAYGSRLGMEYFPARLADLIAFLHDRPPFTEALKPVRAAPAVDPAPQMWMLGSTEEGARLAAHFGLPFCYAHFINPHALHAAVEVYRRDFRPTPETPAPVFALGVFALCARTQERALELALCRDVWRARVEQGHFEPFPTVDQAKAYRLSAEQAHVIEGRRAHQIIGVADEVYQQITALTDATDADEVSIISITHDPDERRLAYALIAQAFGLEATPD